MSWTTFLFSRWSNGWRTSNENSDRVINNYDLPKNGYSVFFKVALLLIESEIEYDTQSKSSSKDWNLYWKH